MDHEHITLELGYGTRGCFQVQLPADATSDEIAYFKTLTPPSRERAVEVLDPDTWAVAQMPPDVKFSSDFARALV